MGALLFQRITLDPDTAAAVGFPPPVPGLMVVKDGIVWRGAPEFSGLEGFGDLGFLWTALIPLGSSLIGGIFGAKAAAKQSEAIKAQAAAQVEIEQLRLQAAQAQAQAMPKNLLLYGGAALLLILLIK